MPAEYTDFATAWEQRFLAVTKEHIESDLTLAEGSRVAEFETGETLSLTVEPGEQDPPNNGWYICEVLAEYRFKEDSDGENVSDTWNQIEEALGDGYLGAAPLYTIVLSKRWLSS